MKIGYYAQAPFIKFNGENYIPFDYAVWAYEFPKHVNEFHFILNHQVANTGVSSSYAKLPENCFLHDIGPLQPHWKRAVGIGLNEQLVKDLTSQLDAFIIQGPTPMQLHLVKNTHSACIAAPLLVGMWKEWPQGMFRVMPRYREWLINGLKKLNRWQTTRLINDYDVFFMGNNPLNPQYYHAKKPFHLISKGLVREHEIHSPQPPTNRKVKNLVFFSRLEPEKNVELLINAVAAFGQKHDVALQVFGDNNTPTYFAFLKKLATDLGIADRVHFNGGIPFGQQSRVFETADIYIFNTCTTEGFPRTIWEGFSFGVPTLAVAYPGAKEFFRDGEQLVLFEQNNLDSLVSKLDLLLSSPDLQQKIVEGAYRLLREHTTEKSVAYLAQILSEAVQKKRGTLNEIKPVLENAAR